MKRHDRTKRKPTPVDGETSTKATANEWKCEVGWLLLKSNRKELTATSQELHRQHSYGM